jgi:threonine synthase
MGITVGEQPVSKRWIVTLAFIATAPASAAAQFTTFIAPPNPVKDSIVAAVAAEQKATADSVTRAQITNMKSWVDSAAGVAVKPASDTAFAVKTITTTTATPTVSQADGVIAPNTASPLPFLLVLGVAAMLLGAFLNRPRPRPIRIDEK